MAQTLILVLVVLVLGIHDAEAQRFRGGNRSGTAAQISMRSPQVAIRSPQVALRTPRGFSQAGRFIVPRTPATFVRIGPATHGLVKIAPVRVFATPVFVTPVAPVFHHFRRPIVSPFFPRLGGIGIVDAPDVVDVTIINEVAPQMGYQDSPIASPTPQSIPGRSADQLVSFDPTRQEVMERLLVLAGVRKGDVVYDLGSGDGRLVIAAAKKFGVKAVGFEIDPGLVKLARENVRKQGVEKLVEIRQQDFMTADVSRASVVTLFNDGNLPLRPALMNRLKPGTRIVSYGLGIGDWAPKIMETYRDGAGGSHLLYLWQVAAPIASSNHSSEIRQ
jgi:protein-L-isoaspartate O-methyltransferase